MIYYSKRYWAFRLLGRLYGSAFPRALVFTVLGTVVTCCLHVFANISDFWVSKPHPYPFAIFSFSVGFALVFRNNFAYHRFWEGRTQMQLMDSKWIDVATQAIFFDRGTLPMDADDEAIMASGRFCETFVHLMSLLHALALQNMRRDWDLDNLSHHDAVESEPNMSIKIRRKLKQEEMLAMLKKSSIPWWHRCWAYLWIGRHNFPVDAFQIRANRLERECYNHMLPLGVISGVTEAEKDMLGKRTFASKLEERDISYLLCGCVHDSENIIPGAGERVHVVNDWIHALIMERRRAGGLRIPAPILTRMFSIMSQGMEGFENCRKLADTPFPFPYAQMIGTLLMMFLFIVPFVFTSFVLESWLSTMLTFMSLLTHFALNELARDMEDPFIYDPNDLPLVKHHYQFNERMLAIARTSRPISNVERHRSLIRVRSGSEYNGVRYCDENENGVVNVDSRGLTEDNVVQCFRQGITYRKLASFVDQDQG